MTFSEKSKISLPNGSLSVDELSGILRNLPVQISFIDAENVFQYFDGPPIFDRDTSMLGTDVYACHTAQTHPLIQEIIQEFRKGTHSQAQFWHHQEDRFLLMRYFAIRDSHNNYVGCLAVYQDIQPLQAITGEQHTLAWED